LISKKKVSFATMNADMGELRGGLKKIENEVEQMKKNKKGVDQFVEEFQISFYNLFQFFLFFYFYFLFLFLFFQFSFLFHYNYS